MIDNYKTFFYYTDNRIGQTNDTLDFLRAQR